MKLNYPAAPVIGTGNDDSDQNMKPTISTRFFHFASMAGMSCLLAACNTVPPEIPTPVPEPPVAVVNASETTILPLLDYFQHLQRITPAELLRERPILLAGTQTTEGQIRLAMLLGQPRTTTDLAKAQALLEKVLRSETPDAINLRPLAQILAINFQERQKFESQNEKIAQQLKAAEMQNDKLVQQLKANQQRIDELQEKLDALADIERSLQVRPGAGNTRPATP